MIVFGSTTKGYGIPTRITALAASSEKSRPSLILPLQTANIMAPF